MSTTTRPRNATPTTVPSTIESAQAKLVYVYLAHEGETTVDALADALGVPKLGLLDVLATLEADGHVDRDDTRTVTFAR
ncbi:helix-turn-helix domain-containing protein [Halorubellus sp. PRR65]|uniref:helix-turn-helix domain-containing protein n=1 Tax=Halorubellus sp. PRR65 TaxID=3098148 RepID=UPI002B25C0FC|nr:helix-turn-helix domain-containing protein [Halorubellus sp. PRR65]